MTKHGLIIHAALPAVVTQTSQNDVGQRKSPHKPEKWPTPHLSDHVTLPKLRCTSYVHI
jgi:hypothetical protein